MIAGIDVDTVDIRRIASMLEKDEDHVFFRRGFTEAEQRIAPDKAHRKGRAAFFAGRFAAKEAVFKAVSHCSGVPLDLRRVEVLRHEDHSPYVNINDDMRAVMEAAGIKAIHISITHESDYATAFAVAEK